jgi:DNA-binding NarL/FixJ family response regulator
MPSDDPPHSTEPIKDIVVQVLLVDDHQMIRQGIKSILECYPNVRVTGEAANGEEGVDMARLLRPDVVVMDINMPKMNGIAATRLIKRHNARVAVIGLSVNGDSRHREAMQQAGADTLLSKEAAAEELYVAIMQSVRPTQQ